MLPSILIVDDEREILKALDRLLNNSFRIYIFTSPREALLFYQDSPTHIVISDLRMPDIDGGEFLKRIVAINPNSKRIALTGYADIDIAKKAFNEGKISYYLNKPWDNDELQNKLSALVEELKKDNKTQNLINKLRVSNKALLMEHRSDVVTHEFLKTQHNDMQSVMTQLRAANNELMLMIVNLIALHTHEPPGHSIRIAQQAKVLATRLGWSEIECLHIYMAGLFHRVGLSTLPFELMSTPWWQLSITEQQKYGQYIKSSVDIMNSSQFLGQSAEMVAEMHVKNLQQQYEQGSDITRAAFGARILHTLINADLLISGRLTGYTISPSKAFIELNQHAKGCNSKAKRLLEQMFISAQAGEVYEYPVVTNALCAGMIIAQSIMDKHEHMLLVKGTSLTNSHIAHLAKLQESTKQPMIVYVEANLNGSE